MKYVRFLVPGTTAPRLGRLHDDRIDELSGWDGDMTALISDTDNARTAATVAQHALPDVRLLAPFMPTTILCSGSNYHAHNREKASSPLSGKEPEFFIKTSDCVIGPDDEVPFDPILTKKLDCETELAIVIGKPGRHIPLEHALDHVFGYSIVNDVTARDRQVRFRSDGSAFYELGRGKVFDGSAPFGPCVVTADEIPDPQRLRLRTRINGELRQSGHTSDMLWSCAHLIHIFSINLTLRPGMVIITGTPAGTAWSVDKELGGNWIPPEDGEPVVPARGYNQPGDVVESEIEGIGTLRVRVSSKNN
ncbi:fumarylacetoacetate hydrolase family protein [Ottowia thiooxydans]|uniref:fumarylacetoacetate hydrolase family protein n=1 Tax=Ottowia thiooxydans TaxID=219182 RepID=UPI00041B342C|nr:fumarylacetoacetate hydrolase family protein [Ottowia thiooxydans]